MTGFEWFFVVLAFLIDLGSYGGGRFAAAAVDAACLRVADVRSL